MKKTIPKASYDSDADILSLTGTVTGRIDHANELGNFVVHFTKDDRPLLIEVLEASKVFANIPKPLGKIANPVFV